ncbi:MAG: FAD-binding protein, partial [Mycobacterium sp.]|nr:FAD-binding protein [Mycobacterium sp.]
VADAGEAPGTPSRPSDYTGQQIYYRSLQERDTDLLTAYDYLWRWDTDWFWCSAAFGAQHPVARRLWPRRWRRSDVYYRMVTLDHRVGLMRRLDARAGRPERERVIQDVEVPVDRLPEFLSWFDDAVGMRPVWLCPLRLREGEGGPRRWPSYPLVPGTTYVNRSEEL